MSCTATSCDMPRASTGEEKTTAILLHDSAASGSMWRETVRILQQSHHVVAPDLIGYGRSPAWRGETFGIDNEVAALENVLPCCGEPFHLVGGLHRRTPGSTHRTIAGSGHLLPLSDSAAVADAIRARVRAVTTRRR